MRYLEDIRCKTRYLISSSLLVKLILSLGPTGPAVRVATADSNSGKGSIFPEMFRSVIFYFPTYVNTKKAYIDAIRNIRA